MWLGNWKRRTRYWLNQRRRPRLLREEVEFHLMMKADELREAGMTEEDARNEARRPDSIQSLRYE